MNNELRATLLSVFTLGYLDAVKGSPIDEDDVIDGETASEIEVAALACIAKAETMLMANYAENPGQCHAELYRKGRDAYLTAASLWMQRN